MVPRRSNPKGFKFRSNHKRKEYKKLTDDLKESSGYPVTVVRDIIDYFIAYMQLQLASGESVLIPGIGKFSRRRVKPRVFYSPIYDKHVLVYTSDTVSFSLDHNMRKAMKLGRESAADRDAYLAWLAELVDEGNLEEHIYKQAVEELKKEIEDEQRTAEEIGSGLSPLELALQNSQRDSDEGIEEFGEDEIHEDETKS